MAVQQHPNTAIQLQGLTALLSGDRNTACSKTHIGGLCVGVTVVNTITTRVLADIQGPSPEIHVHLRFVRSGLLRLARAPPSKAIKRVKLSMHLEFTITSVILKTADVCGRTFMP